MSTGISLEERGVVEVAGPEAAKFLHNILTNDIASLAPDEARFAALLTPQGKILFDFLVFARDRPEGRCYLLDTPRQLVPDLMRRLAMYRLRAGVTLADRSDELACFAVIDASGRPEIEALALARDPRSGTLGWRGVAARGARLNGAREAYDRLRIAACVPAGGVDFPYGDAYPHDANMDWLNGVDFKKGCFIGQEVVSRMKHRGAARKRVAHYRVDGAAPPPATPVRAGDIEVGATGSSLDSEGLALIRTDKVSSAIGSGRPVTADGRPLSFDLPESDAV